ncbi:MAG: type and secretion system protein [Gemmatimonadetes bacterium]|nr:type and secretion system protein [Gemmatimonadota bacterium]
MISTRTLASVMLGALGAFGGSPAAAMAPATHTDATVVSLSVVPATGRADVVIRVDGAVTFKHFTLSKPDKIVVDMSGATLGIPQGDAYDGVARGGITRIRYSQFTKTVVRVVLTLDGMHSYDVSQKDGEVRISVVSPAAQFDPWQIGAEDMKADAEPTLARAEPVERTLVAARAAPAASPVAATRLEPYISALAAKPTRQQSQEPRITWAGENVPINDVIAAFSAFTGRTILASRNVLGTVTANIVNQPWDVALKEIMNANGYDVTVNPDGIIVVDTFEAITARQSTIPLTTQNIRLNYARASSVAPMVRERLTRTCSGSAANSASAGIVQPAPGVPVVTPVVPAVPMIQSLNCPVRGTVTADTLTNSISITDVPSAMSILQDYARSLDLRQPQVNIRAKIILVDRTTLEGLGLRYDLGSQKQFFNDVVPRLDSLGHPLTSAGQILLGGNTISAIANATARIPNTALQLVFSTAMGNFDFTTFLEALQTNTLTDVQAEPSTTVLNNRTANLSSGTDVPIRIIDAGSASGNAATAPRATVSFRPTGVILTVTPQITNNRQVQMRIHVENSTVDFQTNDVGAVFPKQSVDNEMLVADGETAVMGGLTQTNISVTRTGIPILVDLPIIGRLFGVTNRTEHKNDLLILITPHIIDEGQQPLPQTGRP